MAADLYPPVTTATSSPVAIDLTTILSLLTALSLLVTAYLTSLRLLPHRTTPLNIRILYIWHLFDALTHFLLEGSFLYNCFFTYTLLPPSSSDYPHPASLTSTTSAGGGYFLGYKDRLYGSNYGINPTARLWQEYAKADSRWGGADLTVISLELLTVFGAGPLALYVCELIRRSCKDRDTRGGGMGGGSARLWFWATVLASGELYGGFMTFAPEWLSGSPSLDTGNWMYL